jgi:hypothetical protein
MATPDRCFALKDVPTLENGEFPDIFADALGVVVSYGDEGVVERCALLKEYRITRGHRHGIYGAISTITGRAWLIGFDDACYYPEKYNLPFPHNSFAVAGLEANLEHFETLYAAVRWMDRAPHFLWNTDCTYPVDPRLAAGFIASAEPAGAGTVRQYITETLAAQQRPVIVLLHLPEAPLVEMALVAGYEAGGAVILGRSPYRNSPKHSTGEYGYFRMADWEKNTIAVLGVEEEKPAGWDKALCYLAIENALRYSGSCTRGTRHYGLAAYDAWERALLDEESIAGLDDETLSRRLQYHSAMAGFVACQKAFTVLPENNAPTMGVINGLVRRGSNGPVMIHGLMWDVWQVAGAYWRGIPPGDGEPGLRWENTEDLRLFRERSVRERAVRVVRRARQADAQALQDLAEAKEEWDHCLGRGKDHPCPCWDTRCIRV